LTTSGSPSGTVVAASAGVLTLYRAVWAATVRVARARWVSIALPLGLLVVYVVLRSIDADQTLLAGWVVIVALVSILSPSNGLVILVAIAPFTEPFTISRQIGAKPLVVAVLGAAVLIRYIAAGARPRPPLPVILAGGLALGIAAGVGVTLGRFGQGAATDASQLGLAGIGGGMIVLAVAAWVARKGDLRPLVAAVVTGTIAGLISLLDFGSATLVRGGPLDWTVRALRDPGRLMGVIPSPNGIAALLIGPAAILVAAAVLGRDVRLRLLGVVGAVPLLVGLYLTYSRAALIALFLLGVICIWRIRRQAGIVLLVGGLVVGVLLTPAYLQARGQSIGGDYARPQPGQVFIPSDRWRLQAWSAASRMWADEPLTGQGFTAYGQLAVAFGDDVLKAPHNEWLRLFAEEGIVVGVIGIAFVIATFAWLARDRTWLGAGILAAFVGWCVAASFNNPFLYVQVNTVIFTIVGTGIARCAIRRSPA
jgi:hypothetical protein